MTFQTNITKMFGIKYPIFSAPMGPFYTRDLALAVSEAGGLGTLSNVNLLGKDPVQVTKDMMDYLIEHTENPFGYNILVTRASPAAQRFVKEIPEYIMENAKLKEQALYALSSAGSAKVFPSSKSFQKLREITDIKHFHVAPALWLGDKCVAAGVDGVVVTGFEGGGHQAYEKVSSLVLLQQMHQKHPDLPKIACGGFATGVGLAAALSLGAGAIAMGSRFIASIESEFHETFKGIIPSAKAPDTQVVTGALSIIRLWENKYSRHHDMVASRVEKLKQEAERTVEATIEEAKAYELAYTGNIEDGAVPLGQSIGLIDKLEPVSDIIERIIKDAKTALRKASSFIT